MSPEQSKAMLDDYYRSNSGLVVLSLQSNISFEAKVIGYFYDNVDEGTVWKWRLIMPTSAKQNIPLALEFYETIELLSDEIEKYQFK